MIADPDFDAGLRTRFLERVAALARERPDIVTVLAVRTDFNRALSRTPLPVPADDAGVVRVEWPFEVWALKAWHQIRERRQPALIN